MNELITCAWEQMQDEPKRAYARFLVYLYLGPARSVEKAIALDDGKKREGNSGQWFRDSAKYDWPDRAASYDIAMLSRHGTSVVINWVNALVGLSEMAVEEVKSGKHRPRNLQQLIEVVNVLGSFVTPEVVQAAREFASGDFGKPDDEGDST